MSVLKTDANNKSFFKNQKFMCTMTVCKEHQYYMISFSPNWENFLAHGDFPIVLTKTVVTG